MASTELLFFLIWMEYQNTLKLLTNELKNNPDRDESEIESLKWRLGSEIYNEFEKYEESEESNSSDIDDYELRDHMDELIDAVFGKADFEGEVLQVILPLDDGKIFYPLGTSGGWSNNVGDIDILFKVPDDTSLSLEHSKDAFFEGSHWYLFQMENSNPDFDLESSLNPSDSEEKSKMERAAFVYDNSQGLGLIIIFVILVIFWLSVVVCLKFIRRRNEKIIPKVPVLLLLLGVSLFISIPAALLILLLIKPIPPQKLREEFLPSTLLLLYPVSIIIFLLGVFF